MTAAANLGHLGSIDHSANTPLELRVGYIGKQYRVVKSRTVNGRIVDEQPVDSLVFYSVSGARKHRAVLAERERCAQIVEARRIGFADQDAELDQIIDAIRTPLPPKPSSYPLKEQTT